MRREEPVQAEAAVEEEEGRRQLARLMALKRPFTDDEARLFRKVFDYLYDDHFETVWNELRRRGVPEAEREDLTNGVFLNLYLAVLAGQSPDDVPSDLAWRARGKAFDAGRADKRNPVSIGLPSSNSQQPRSTPQMERLLDLKDLLPRVLPHLSPEHRAVIDAVILREQSQEAAAEELGIHRTTLASRLKVALDKLDELLAPLLPASQR